MIPCDWPLTRCMKQISSSEYDSRLSNTENPPSVETEGLLPDSQLVHISTRYTLSRYFIKIRSYAFLQLLLGLRSGLSHSSFPTKYLYVFLISPMRATSCSNLILLGLIFLITFCCTAQIMGSIFLELASQTYYIMMKCGTEATCFGQFRSPSLDLHIRAVMYVQHYSCC